MRIVIDIQGAQTESRFRGIGRYSMALTKEIARQAGSHDVRVVLNGNFPETIDAIRNSFDGLIPQNHIHIFKTPRPISNGPDNFWRVQAAEMLREAFLADLKPDIVYLASLFEAFVDDSSTSVGIFEKAGKTAVTLYDLIPYLNQEAYLVDESTQNYYFRKIDSLKRADLLLAISEYARQEGLDILNFPPQNVVNISTAADDHFHPVTLSTDKKNALLASFNIQKPFILYTGGFDGRKNLLGLIEAFSLLPDRIRRGHQLLIAGKCPKHVQQWLRSSAEKWGVTGALLFTDYITDEDLVGLYNTCALFVFASLHEGFGLPALEAMACGAPVIGSNTTSIPEVIGHKDALFDPSKPEYIAEKITRVLSDENLRNNLREYGLKQAKNFTWQESARRTIEAFENLEIKPDYKKMFFPTQNKERYNRLIASIATIPQDKIRAAQGDLVSTAQSVWHNTKEADRAIRTFELGEKINWRIEGPFDSSYSLSLLNRETALALAELGHDVSLWSTEGPGDFEPNQEFLRENPDLAQMYRRAQDTIHENTEVVSRNLYPPRVADMQGRINLLHHYAWEESGLPGEWVDSFNKNLQGITCLSTHVERILVNNGINLPLSTSGCGVDHWEKLEPDTYFRIEARGFRFLHVSSCFPRKGADILLDAYGQNFKDIDDVSLIIKTFKNPHNQIHDWLAERKLENPHFPHVIIIEDDLSDAQLKSLYQQSHALVGPSRAEGFGLPFAEAMLSGLPVITTRWGGQLDFCNEETAWLVDYKFEQAETHFNLFDSVWAEPDPDDLAQKMWEVYTSSDEQRKSRADAGRHLLLDRFRWVDVARRAVQSAKNWASIPETPDPKIGWITTWNTKCGIATYSEHLLRNMPGQVHVLGAYTDLLTAKDTEIVTRSWNKNDIDSDELNQTIEEKKLDILILQFNYGFFDFKVLSEFLNYQLDAGRIVVVVFHSTSDPLEDDQKKLSMLVPALKRCQKLLVHSVNDLNRLKDLGLIENVALFPQGVAEYRLVTEFKPAKEKIIASYGFFLPHKGLLDMIDAVALMRKSGEKVKLLLVNAEYPVPVSIDMIGQAREKIEQLKLGKYVDLITDYLPEQKSLNLISQADLIIFPYQVTGESSSAAVRSGLATGRPIAVTPLAIFDDVTPAVFKLPGKSSAHIAQGLVEILREIETGSARTQLIGENAVKWRKAHLYSHLSIRLYGMIQALYRRQESLQVEQVNS